MKNIFSDVPYNLPNELIEIIAENNDIRIERIVSRGHTSPPGFWYDQDKNEFVLLVSGEALLKFEEKAECIRMQAGDYIIITAHVRHRVEWIAPNRDIVWLAVHY